MRNTFDMSRSYLDADLPVEFDLTLEDARAYARHSLRDTAGADRMLRVARFMFFILGATSELGDFVRYSANGDLAMAGFSLTFAVVGGCLAAWIGPLIWREFVWSFLVMRWNYDPSALGHWIVTAGPAGLAYESPKDAAVVPCLAEQGRQPDALNVRAGLGTLGATRWHESRSPLIPLPA